MSSVAGPDHPADRAQRGRLAGAVGAQDGGDAALLHREAHAVEHVGPAVAGVELVGLQQGRHQRSLPR
jgi:hypothetical protein